jgi:hypothetical protein
MLSTRRRNERTPQASSRMHHSNRDVHRYRRNGPLRFHHPRYDRLRWGRFRLGSAMKLRQPLVSLLMEALEPRSGSGAASHSNVRYRRILLQNSASSRPFEIMGIGAPPILQFSSTNPFAINKSAVSNSTGPKPAYTEAVSCREAEVDNSQSVQGMWFECDAEDVRENRRRSFEERKRNSKGPAEHVVV